MKPMLVFSALLAAFLLAYDSSHALAQNGRSAVVDPSIPNFVDPGRYSQKPETGAVRRIKFLTELDAPPFSYLGPDGEMTGFNVELAREVCRVLDLACTIQGLKWDLLLKGIEEKRGDAIIAGLAITPESRKQFAFSDRYLGRPGRFAGKTAVILNEAKPEAFAGEIIAVVKNSAHEAFLVGQFPGSVARQYDTLALALDGLKKDEAKMVFADGLSLSLWLNGSDSENCCKFIGGPFTEARYFGEGMAIATSKNNQALIDVLNHGLARVGTSNAFVELYLRYFPISFY